MGGPVEAPDRRAAPERTLLPVHVTTVISLVPRGEHCALCGFRCHSSVPTATVGNPADIAAAVNVTA